MSAPIDDKTLQEYLKGDSPLSQRYRELDENQVPAHLDTLVLQQARDAVAVAPAVIAIEQSRLRQSRRRLMRWTVPATIAASTVLVISIVIESGNRHLVTAPADVPAAANAIPQSLQKEAPRADESINAPSESQPVPAPPPVPMAPVDKRSMKAAPAMRVQKPVGAVAAPASPIQDESEKAASAAKREEPYREGPAPTGVISARQQSTVIEPAAVAAPASANRSGDTKDRSDVASAAASREQASGVAASQRSAEVDLQEVAVTGSRAKRSVAPTAGPRGTIAQNAAPLERTEAVQDETNWRAEPETWLEHIRQLRAAGSGNEADTEWKRFRAAYPDYSVAETDAARAKR
ncbi:MAG TPA: hypothetical protein VGN07_21215 [Steroidobacteraceae bacterium]|jgi:hypothetical protein